MNNKKLIINKSSAAYLAIAKLKSGDSVLFYDVDLLDAVIVTPIKSINKDIASEYAAHDGYILFSKEKINTLWSVNQQCNVLIPLSMNDLNGFLTEIKSTFCSNESLHKWKNIDFFAASNLDDLALMLTKEAEEIPVLIASKLRFLSVEEIISFSFRNNLVCVSVNDCLNYRRDFGLLHLSTSKLILHDMGEVFLYLYKDVMKHHCAIVKQNIIKANIWHNPIVRIHSSCYTGDVLGSMQCDCCDQLHKSMHIIAKDGEGGMIIYLNQEGRNIGLDNKLKSYHLQKCGMDTVEANHALGFSDDERDFTVALKILEDLNVKKMRLITNNPSKVNFMKGSGISVESFPIITKINLYNKNYLETKVKKMGHKISSCM